MFLSLKGGKKSIITENINAIKTIMLIIHQPREYPTGSCWLCPFLNLCLPQGRYQNMFVFYNPATVSAKPVDPYSVSLRFLASLLRSGVWSEGLSSKSVSAVLNVAWSGPSVSCIITPKTHQGTAGISTRDAGKQECSQTGQPSACHCLTQHRYNQEH